LIWNFFTDCNKTSATLEQVILNLINCSKSNRFDFLKPLQFFFACELLKEIIYCLNNLHSRNPPIIYCDLTPSETIVAMDENLGKINIFINGLIKSQNRFENLNEQPVIGLKYKAPEVMNKKQVCQKSDIYSLGVIMQELFNVDINK
jgi:serine/threonine protein kinase